jgi:hypothetical protein
VEFGVAGRFSFNTIQAVVGLVAGLTSIVGAAYSAVGLFGPATPTGEIVAVVRDAESQRPVGDATIEILTPANGLVTAVPQDADGRAHREIAPGMYRVRVAHPRYATASREIHVAPDGVAEMHVNLEPRGRKPADTAAAASSPKRRAATPDQVVEHVTRRVFGRLGL